MIIVLLGYMASGKSLVGRELSRILNYGFIDLDDYIEKKEGVSISQLFEKKGEIYFRKQESHCLRTILEESSNIVLALGGGTPCYANNIEMILSTKNVTSFYLNASIPTLISRLQNETSTRPLVSRFEDKDSLIEFIGKHLFERRSFYMQAGDTIHTDGKNVEEISEEIIARLF